MLLFLLLQILLHPPGVHPNLWPRYEAHVDNQTDSFTCFDDETIIPLSQFNDGFVDCPDGSDEPSTGANLNGRFYCLKDDIQPIELKAWMVGDGLCDCCDGTDETFNPRAHCENQCDNRTAERENLTGRLALRFRRGMELQKKLAKQGIALMEKSDRRRAILEVPIGAMEQLLDRLMVADWNITTGRHRYNEYIHKVFIAAWHRTFHVREPKNNFWAVLRRALIIDLKSLLDWLTTKVEQVSLHDTDNAIAPAALVLYAKQFTFEKKITLYFLRSVHKDNKTLGKFNNMSESVMWYDNGDRCANAKKGKFKSFKFDLVCSNESAILSAFSPDECTYKGVFGSPINCNATTLDDLKTYPLKKLDNLTKLFDPPK